MDWSLIMLLFAAGFALGGLALLITAVHKVITELPPSQNIPPTTLPSSYTQPQPQMPTYNWSLNGFKVQKLALGQGSGGTAKTSSHPRESLPGVEEGEFGFIPIAYSSVQAKIPVFQPEPLNHAERVYEEPLPAPRPNSVAIPVDEAPDSNAIAVPIAYFREPPGIQDVPARRMKESSCRTNHVTAVADPIHPDGEVRNFFRDSESEIIETADAEISDAPASASVSRPDPPQILDLEETQVEEAAAPGAGDESAAEPSAFDRKPRQGAAVGSVIKPESEPETAQIHESGPITKPKPKPGPAAAVSSPQKTGGTKSARRRKKSRKKKSRPQQKKASSVPTELPTEQVSSSNEEKKPESKQKTEEAGGEQGQKDRGEKLVRKYAERLIRRIPKPIQDAARPILCCLCVAVCLICLSLYFYFDKNPSVNEAPVTVDISQENQMSEPTGKNEPGLSNAEEPEPVFEEILPRYTMAVIGEQEAISTTAEGFEPSFEPDDYTDVSFYALSFAIQLDSDPGEECQKIEVFDSVTMENLTSTTSSVLHVYTGEVPFDDYFMAHPVKSAPVVSSAVSDEIITCVFVSLEKRSIQDLKVTLFQASNGTDEFVKNEVSVNGTAEDLSLTPKYPMGNSLLKLGGQYYVVESGTGIGSVPDENKYVTRKLRCISMPLTGSVSGLDASSIALFDRQTGEKRELPAGTEMYYKEEYEENEALMDIAFGIQLSGGSYNEATDFLDNSFPGYIVGNHIILF